MEKEKELQTLRKKVRTLENEIKDEKLKSYLDTLISKTKTMKGKYYLKNLSGYYDEAWLYKIETVINNIMKLEKEGIEVDDSNI